MNVFGKIEYVEFPRFEDCPFLVLTETTASGEVLTHRVKLDRPDSLKLLHRKFSSGDRVRCCLASDDVGGGLRSLTLLERTVTDQGARRMIRVQDKRDSYEFPKVAFEYPSEITDEHIESVLDGEIALDILWDAGEPYGSGSVQILRSRGICFCSTDEGIFGPFHDFRSALSWLVPDFLNETVQSISCAEMPAEALAKLLIFADTVPVGTRIEINGKRWSVNNAMGLHPS